MVFSLELRIWRSFSLVALRFLLACNRPQQRGFALLRRLFAV
jgi:hypothetical protein